MVAQVGLEEGQAEVPLCDAPRLDDVRDAQSDGVNDGLLTPLYGLLPHLSGENEGGDILNKRASIHLGTFVLVLSIVIVWSSSMPLSI